MGLPVLRSHLQVRWRACEKRFWGDVASGAVEAGQQVVVQCIGEQGAATAGAVDESRACDLRHSIHLANKSSTSLVIWQYSLKSSQLDMAWWWW